VSSVVASPPRYAPYDGTSVPALEPALLANPAWTERRARGADARHGRPASVPRTDVGAGAVELGFTATDDSGGE
jgi:hypothetical protein